MDVLLKHGAKVNFQKGVYTRYYYLYVYKILKQKLSTVTIDFEFVVIQVNALDGLGQTALHRVAQQGNMQACRLLMSYAVDSSIVSLQGYTAAQLATENIQKMLKGKQIMHSIPFLKIGGGGDEFGCMDTLLYMYISIRAFKV